MGLSRLFFAWESTELLGTPSQMHRHVDHNLISQLTTTRVGWRWVDSRGLGLPSQIFQNNFIKIKNKCFVAFGIVGERRVGADPVKFNLGVHGCFQKLNPIPGTLKVMLLRVANPQDLKNLFKIISNQNVLKSEIFIKMKNKCFWSGPGKV